MKYLLCPKCGAHRFYIKQNNITTYFHVDFNQNLLSTAQSNSDLSTVNIDELFCAGCSWSGRMGRLVKAF